MFCLIYFVDKAETSSKSVYADLIPPASNDTWREL